MQKETGHPLRYALYQNWCPVMVEVRGVEPLSENLLPKLSTSVVYRFNSRKIGADKQAPIFSNPLYTHNPGVQAMRVHHLVTPRLSPWSYLKGRPP